MVIQINILFTFLNSHLLSYLWHNSIIQKLILYTVNRKIVLKSFVFVGNVGELTLMYIPKGQTHPVPLSPHDYTVVPNIHPGTVTIKFNPMLETTSFTVVVNKPASPNTDYTLHLSVTACFEHTGMILLIFWSNY